MGEMSLRNLKKKEKKMTTKDIQQRENGALLLLFHVPQEASFWNSKTFWCEKGEKKTTLKRINFEKRISHFFFYLHKYTFAVTVTIKQKPRKMADKNKLKTTPRKQIVTNR